MGTNRDIMILEQIHGLLHRGGISRMKPAGNVSSRNILHGDFIISELVEAKALPHIAI